MSGEAVDAAVGVITATDETPTLTGSSPRTRQLVATEAQETRLNVSAFGTIATDFHSFVNYLRTTSCVREEREPWRPPVPAKAPQIDWDLPYILQNFNSL